VENLTSKNIVVVGAGFAGHRYYKKTVERNVFKKILRFENHSD